MPADHPLTAKFIYCPVCQAVQPLVIDDLPADDQNPHPATDLLCGVCHAIVATLHHRPDARARATDAAVADRDKP